MIETIIVTSLILLAVFGIELQYIVNSLATPKGLVYLGTVHWPSDYFYYLSQFVQGKQNFLSSTMLYTPEKLKPVLTGWQNVLSGKILMGLGFDVILAYQVAVAIYLGLFIYIAYNLIKEIFPDSRGKRMLALVFFITSTSMFRILRDGGGWQFSYWTHWYNLGSALSRFSPTPHHLLAYSLGTFILLMCIKWVKNGFRNKYLAFLSIAGFLLASINPVAWGLTTLSILTAGAIYVVKERRWNYLLLGFLLIIAGIMPAVYTRTVFNTSVYKLSSAWESVQQLKITPLWLCYNSGLVVVLALFGVWSYWKKTTFSKILLFIFLSWAVFFYISGVPERIKISNARFWPSQVYIAWAVLGAEGVIFTANLFRKFYKIALIILLLIYTATIVPTYYVQYKELLTPKLKNSYYYLSSDTYQAILQSGKISSPEDVFLVVWPINESFPALTARKTLFGYELFTLDYPEKMREGFAIIDGKYTQDELKKTLNIYRIKYLFMYSWNNYFRQFTFLREVYKNPEITIYEVTS